jgi:hypothetical protein
MSSDKRMLLQPHLGQNKRLAVPFNIIPFIIRQTPLFSRRAFACGR